MIEGPVGGFTISKVPELILSSVYCLCGAPTNVCLLFRCVQVRVLTELDLFAEAVKEIQSLSDGEEVPLPHNSYTRATKASV